MKAPEALYGGNAARKNHFKCSGNRVARNDVTLIVGEREFRAADRTGIWLRVEAPVGRIFVFGAADQTHRKDRHGGLCTVIGNTARNRVARTAVRAVSEGVAPPAVRFGKDL